MRGSGGVDEMRCRFGTGCLLAGVFLMTGDVTAADSRTDEQAVSALDRRFQEAVKHNDVQTMGDILHPDMVLVLGDGRVFTRDEQLREAGQRLLSYEVQDEEPGTQTVRINGSTGVVTALLRIKGNRKGVPFDYRVWFSDTYVLTPSGWKYFFGQASLALPGASGDAQRTK